MFLLGSVKKENRYVLFHNVISHENKPFEKFLLQRFIKIIGHCIVMNNYNKELILKINPKANIISNFHPIYEIPYSDNSNNNYKADLNIKLLNQLDDGGKLIFINYICLFLYNLN